MNFMGKMENEEIHVELKYCERCGGLWLRPQGTEGAYCAGCREHLESRPDPGEALPRKRRRRKRRGPAANLQSGDLRSSPEDRSERIDRLQGVAVSEVQA